ncbi:hypothetical protein SAMN06265222_10935 [Neorhodopirellula lusitana]|uniref:Uncharacterized protein n=1 Tax=Neorhodopirellula lusitana TaxID=445327 RepID=A0ABY1QA81_9BACT|nr:hypothetical protein SAMN06265222_10935 [Neorhodopirellula lusitana]
MIAITTNSSTKVKADRQRRECTESIASRITERMLSVTGRTHQGTHSFQQETKKFLTLTSPKKVAQSDTTITQSRRPILGRSSDSRCFLCLAFSPRRSERCTHSRPDRQWPRRDIGPEYKLACHSFWQAIPYSEHRIQRPGRLGISPKFPVLATIKLDHRGTQYR